MKFLSEEGLNYLVSKLKGLFATKKEVESISKDGIVEAKQVVHTTNSGSSTNYDLLLGSKDEGYIQIDSPRTVTSEDQNKNGNIIIVPAAKGSVNIGNAANNLNLNAKDAQITTSGAMKITATTNADIKVTNAFSVAAKGKVEITNGTAPNGFRIKMENDSIYVKKRVEGNVVEPTILCIDIDNFKFFDNLYNMAKGNFSFLKDVLQGSQNQVRLRTSESNSVRLTEGEGFKVFANLYADPEHCTDLDSFSDAEKVLLQTNTVQKLLLTLSGKAASNKAKIKKMNTPMQTVARKAIKLGSAGKNVRYYHKRPTIVLGDGRYTFRYLDKASNEYKPLTLSNSKGHNTVTNQGSYIYEVKNLDKECWGNLYFLGDSTNITPLLIKVESVVIQKNESGKSCKVVTLDIQDAPYYTGSTTSPYMYIHYGVLGGTGKCFADLPFEEISCNKFKDVKTYEKAKKNKVYLYVKYYNKQYSDYCPVLKTRRYHLVNRTFSDLRAQTYNKASHKRGDAIVKWIHKGVVVATRNIRFNGKTNKFWA